MHTQLLCTESSPYILSGLLSLGNGRVGWNIFSSPVWSWTVKVYLGIPDASFLPSLSQFLLLSFSWRWKAGGLLSWGGTWISWDPWPNTVETNLGWSEQKVFYGKESHRINGKSKECKLEGGQEWKEVATRLDTTTGSDCIAACGPKDLLQRIPWLTPHL